MVRIEQVAPGSFADAKGIIAGDIIISINGNEICDVIDYRFYLADSSLSLIISRDGIEKSISIEKDIYDDIGLDFETPLMDKKQRCQNKCVFCFIDQLPDGLRELCILRMMTHAYHFYTAIISRLPTLKKRMLSAL